MPSMKKDLAEQLPATGKDLIALEQEYGGKYNALIGQFLHVEQVSCFDLCFAVSRLAHFNGAPNVAAFQGLKHIAQFLATYLHTPIFYPCLKLTMTQTIRFEHTPGQLIDHVISNL